MRTAAKGDRVQVHYVKHYQHGSVVSSRSRCDAPLELTVGMDNRRLPGLGLRLVGLAPGNHVKLRVPAEQAHGLPDPSRIRRLARIRFPRGKRLEVGKWVRILDNRGRRRPVRILEVTDQVVVVDANHPRAGQAVDLDVELIAIQGPDTVLQSAAP